MNPFEDLIRELGAVMDIPLHVDNHQACLLTFREDELAIQIDLDTNADRILIGSQLGRITPGVYRERVFTQALRANGTASTPRGILAFSEKNDTLVLFQFLEIAWLTGEKLHEFLLLFREHASIWKRALAAGDIPTVVAESTAKGSSMFGLKP
ncbi:CesT family type III secretion system chaperone [Chlamydiota bacterium]